MDKTFAGYNTSSMEVSPKFEPYSKVILLADDETAYIAGDDSGRVLEASLPWATQQIANDVLASVKGFSYQPFAGTDVLVDPAAELGDGITIGGAYGILAAQDMLLDALFTADISAPHEEEIDHEYHYESKPERDLNRKITQGKSYYGTRITRANGLEIVKTEQDGTEKRRAKLNSDVLAFYDEAGEEALYFDAAAGKYRFRGDVDIIGGKMNINDNFIVDADGNLTINGNINLSKGSITWGGNKPESGISESDAKTLITEELISSPVIKGAKIIGDAFMMYANEADMIPMFSLGNYTNDAGQTVVYIDSSYGIAFEIWNAIIPSAELQSVSMEMPLVTTFGGNFLIRGGYIGISDSAEIRYDKCVTEFYGGTVDFSGATVTGLSVVFG